MGYAKAIMASGLVLLMVATSLSWAGTFDFNPNQIPIKHKNDVTSDVQGEGYFE